MEKNENTAFLKTLKVFSEEDIERLAVHCTVRNFRKKENILVAGQIQKDLFFVKSGIQMSFFDNDDKLQVMAFTYAPGICAIPDSFLFQKASEYSLTCLSDSEMLAISFTQLNRLFDESHSLERVFRKLTEQILAGVLSRHLELHTLSIEERFRAFCKRSPQLLQEVPHKYLANYLGIDPSNFSKLFNSIKI